MRELELLSTRASSFAAVLLLSGIPPGSSEFEEYLSMLITRELLHKEVERYKLNRDEALSLYKSFIEG